MNKSAKLVLEDGSIFYGKSIGANISKSGEVVFATGMVGYDQSLTDPSYCGQVLTFTYPLIGNWGVPDKSLWESDNIQPSGLIISTLTEVPSHWQSTQTLNNWLVKNQIPAISEIDTRALTQKLRQKGVMLGKIVTEDQDIDFYDSNTENLVAKVSPKKLTIHQFAITNKQSINIGLLNCGAKENIKRSLLKRGVTVYDMPWNFDPFKENLPLDGLLISNGPGNPQKAKEAIDIIKKSLSLKLPTLGICLGNQLLALAAGGKTYKLKYGHRAQNQPTIEAGTKHCIITTQNHGYAVDEKHLPKGFRSWFYNANDGTNEGLMHEKLPFFSVQFHPEASPGPTDAQYIFDYFLKRVRSGK